MLGLLAGSLLVLPHLLSQLEIVVRVYVDPLHTRVSHGLSPASLVRCHVKNRWCLRRVVDDDVVNVVVVYDVRNVATLRLGLNTLLGVSWGRSPTAHAEPLAIRISRSLEATLVLTLLSHRVLSQFL